MPKMYVVSYGDEKFIMYPVSEIASIKEVLESIVSYLVNEKGNCSVDDLKNFLISNNLAVVSDYDEIVIGGGE